MPTSTTSAVEVEDWPASCGTVMSMAFSGVDTKVTGWESLLVARCCLNKRSITLTQGCPQEKKKMLPATYTMSFHRITLTSRISLIPLTVSI